MRFKEGGADNEVCGSGFILKGNKDNAFGGSWALSRDNESGGSDTSAYPYPMFGV
jgi:hypothetical protein